MAKSKTVKTMLPANPFITGKEAEQEFYSVNFKNYLIRTDEVVELPAEVAELVENNAKARRMAKKYAQKKAFKDAKPPTV